VLVPTVMAAFRRATSFLYSTSERRAICRKSSLHLQALPEYAMGAMSLASEPPKKWLPSLAM